jgi:hypothetical protein
VSTLESSGRWDRGKLPLPCEEIVDGCFKQWFVAVTARISPLPARMHAEQDGVDKPERRMRQAHGHSPVNVQ